MSNIYTHLLSVTILTHPHTSTKKNTFDQKILQIILVSKTRHRNTLLCFGGKNQRSHQPTMTRTSGLRCLMAAAVLASTPYCPAAGTISASSLGICSWISIPKVPSPDRYAALSSLGKGNKMDREEERRWWCENINSNLLNNGSNMCYICHHSHSHLYFSLLLHEQVSILFGQMASVVLRITAGVAEGDDHGAVVSVDPEPRWRTAGRHDDEDGDLHLCCVVSNGHGEVTVSGHDHTLPLLLLQAHRHVLRLINNTMDTVTSTLVIYKVCWEKRVEKCTYKHKLGSEIYCIIFKKQILLISDK